MLMLFVVYDYVDVICSLRIETGASKKRVQNTSRSGRDHRLSTAPSMFENTCDSLVQMRCWRVSLLHIPPPPELAMLPKQSLLSTREEERNKEMLSLFLV